MPDHFNRFARSTWKNPTQHVQRFEIFENSGLPPTRIEIKPGEIDDTIPSIYDNAIRTVRDGVVVGGLAPLLVKVGETAIPVHAAISRSAAMGDEERKLLEMTGSTAGGLSLNNAVALQAKNEELEKKLAEQAAMHSKQIEELKMLILEKQTAPLTGAAASPAKPK